MKIERRWIKKEINVEECIFSSNAKKMPFCFIQKTLWENPEKKEINGRVKKNGKKEREKDREREREKCENKFFK